MIIEKRDEVPTTFRAAGCFCVHKQHVLVMQRQRHKAFEFHWAIPTGKIEAGETPVQCVARELNEELGLEVDAKDLVQIGDDIITDDPISFEYVSFVLDLEKYWTERPEIDVFFLKSDEVRLVEWVEIENVRKRRVVPYFFNTIQSLQAWKDNAPVQQRLLPVAEARGARRRRA